MNTNNPEVAKEFHRIFEEEPQIIKKWLRWADTAIKSMGKDIPIAHISADDIVRDIIIKTIDGDRNWEIGVLPANVYMYNTIRSEVSNHKSKEKRRKFFTVIDEAGGTVNEDEILDSINTEREDDGSTDFVKEIENKELLDLISKEIEADYECSILLEAMKETDHTKNKEIAELTGYTVEKVENIKKKFFRRTLKAAAKYKI